MKTKHNILSVTKYAVYFGRMHTTRDIDFHSSNTIVFFGSQNTFHIPPLKASLVTPEAI